MLWSFGALALAMCVLYAAGLERDPTQPAPGDLAAIGRTALEIASIALGPAGRSLWIVEGVGVVIVGALAALFSALAIRRPEARIRAIAAFCCLAGFGGLVATIAYGRSGLGTGQGFSDRYAIFSAAMLCVAYLALQIFAPKRVGVVRVGLVVAACAALPGNVDAGRLYGMDRSAKADALVRDAARGLSTDLLVSRHVNRLYPSETELRNGIELLRKAHLPPFAAAETPIASCTREEIVEPRMVMTHDLDWSGARGKATGVDPYVVLALPSPRYVCTVTITFRLVKPGAPPATLELFWASNTIKLGERSETAGVQSTPETQTAVYWIGETIDTLRLDPDAAPGEFAIERIALGTR